MAYFDSFQKIPYEFIIDGETKSLIVLDITKNVRFVKKFIDSIPYNSTYRLSDGERLDVISEKLYGNPHYDVLLMLLNGIIDIHTDLPIPSHEFDNFMNNLYGDKQFDTKYFIDAYGYKVDASVLITLTDNEDSHIVGETTYSKLKVGDIISKTTSDGNYHAIVKQITGKTISCVMSHGNIRIGDIVEVSRYTNGIKTIIDSENSVINSVITKLDIIKPVTNYEYEFNLNEQKRNIKVIPKEQISYVQSEFERLMNE